MPARANLQRHGNGHGTDDGRDDSLDERFVLKQRRAGPGFADFLRGAPHVDVDDLGAMVDGMPRCHGERLRIGARNLHADGRRLSVVVEPLCALARAPQARIRSRHLGDGVTGAEPLAQQAKRLVRDAGHRGQNQRRIDVIRADAHEGRSTGGARV
jgi:hypothetical protein